MADETPELEQFPHEASADQEQVAKEERARHKLALEDDLVPLPSGSSVVDDKGHPDPLTPWELERDPLEPLIPAEVVAPGEHERLRDPDTGRVESQDEADARVKAAEKAAAERRKARKAKAAEKDK